MNHIYRLVFNRALSVMQVASELTHTPGSGGSAGGARNVVQRRKLAAACLLALSAGLTTPAFAARNVTISNGSNSNVSAGPIYTASGDSAVVNAGGIGTALTGGTNVFVFTNTAANGTQNGDITGSAAITATGASSLFLEAAGSIFLDSNIPSTASPLNVQLWANYGGSTAGTSYSSNATCGSSTSCAVVVGNTGNATISTGGGNVDIETTGAVQIGNGANTGAINAGTGTLNIGSAASITEGSAGSITAGTLTGSSTGNTTLNGANLIGTMGSFNAANFSLKNAQALTVNGPLTTTGGTGNISLTTTSGALTVNTALVGNAVSLAGATGIMLNNNVSTSGGQTYSGAVTLGADTTLVSSGNGTINFISAVDGTHKLSVSTGGAVTLGGAVGSGAPLTSLTANSSTFSANALTINGLLSVTTTAGGITQGGAFTVAGTSSFNAGANAITLTNASNAFTRAVSLIGGSVSLTNNRTTVLGASAVTGTLAVGSNGALTQTGALTVTGAATFTQNSTIAGTSQDIDLGTQANDFKAGVTIAAAAGAAINNLSLKNTDATPGTLTLPASVAGNLTLNYTNAALTVPVVGVGGNLDVSAGGSGITINGNVGTGGGQTYNNAVTLGADATLASTGNGAIDFASTVDGAHNLTVNTGGLTTFGGAVGGTTALTSLTTDAAGSTMLGGNVSTTGAQTYNDTVTLSGDATLTSTGGGVIDLASTVGGAHNLSVSTSGAAIYGGAVTLTSLTTNSGTFSSGNLTINGPLSVTTTAGGIAQTSGVFTVSGTSTFGAVGHAITLTSLNAFGGTVNLTGNAAQITNMGNLALGTLNTGALTAISATGALNLGSGSVVGTLSATSNGLLNESGGLNVTGLASFTQNGSGADVDLSQANDFHGGVTISGASINNLSLKNTDATPGTLTLPASVAGNLTLNYTNAALTVPVTGVGGALNVSAGNGITINGNVSTGGGQAYNNAVTLSADATLASTGNGAIDFVSTVDGAHTLTVNTAGITTFGGTVGGTTALMSLTTDAGGVTTLGGNVSTTGAQTYNDAVTLGADVMLTSSGGGAIGFGSTVNGAHNLTVNTGGLTTFGGAVGGTAQLTRLTTNSNTFSAASTLRIGSGGLSVTTSGGGIAQSGAFTVAGVSNFNPGTNAITLTNAGNSFTGAVSLTNSGLNNVALVNNGPLTLGNVTVGSGTLSLTGNGIVQSAGTAVTQAPLAGAATLNAGTGVIALGNANNDFVGAVSATGTGITLSDKNNLTLSSLSNGANGAVNLQAAGTLTLPAMAIATGTSNLTLGSGTGSLATAGDLSGANVSLSGGAGVTLANNVTTGGNLTLMSSGGSISNTTGMLTAGTLTGHSTGATTLTGTNQIGSLGAFTANGFTLTNAQALTVIGAVSGGTGATTLTTTGAGSGLDVAATGSFNGGTVSLAAGGGMNLAGNVSGVTVGLSASGTMLLTGTITSTGGTTVQAGKLEVGDATHPGASVVGNMVVNSGAVLGGHGTIGGDVALASGAHLAPGGSIGTLTINGNATFAQGSVLDYEFGAPGASFTTLGTGDSVKVGGNLTLNGAVLNVANAGGFGPGLYNLFTWGGSLTETNGGLALGLTPGGTYLIQKLTANKQINLLNTTGMTLNLWNANGLASTTQMGGGNGTWTTTSPNWTDASANVTAPMQSQPGFAIFGGAPGTVTVDNSVGTVSATGLQFASNGYTLNGGALTLVGNGGVAPIIRVGDGSAAGAGYTATINNVIAGANGLTKSDLGTLVLAGANTYSGGTTINGGTLEAANNAALGSGSVTVDNTANQGATLKVRSGITLANPIAVNNGSTLDNAGTISHTGASDIGVNATGGMTTVTNHAGGSIAGGVIGLWLHTGGTVLNTGSTSNIGGINYALVTDGSPSNVTNQNGAIIRSTMTDAVLMIQGGTLTNDSSANISGNVGVRMSQAGTLTNQGGASINGTTNANGTGYGVILHQGGTVTNQGGASITGTSTGIALQGNTTVINAAGSSISGPDASVSIFGSGAVNLTNAGALNGNVLLGGNEVNTVTLIRGSTLTGALNIGSNTGSRLTLDGTGTQLYSTAVTGTTSFAGTLTKQGSGTWIVDSNLAPTNTVINAGILQIGNSGTAGRLAGNITDNTALVSNLSGAATLAGAISGTGSLTQSGTGVLTLTGANSYSGGTIISAGTLQGDTTSLQGNITDNAALVFKQNSAGTFAGVISGTGSLTQSGGGVLTLTGTNTYTGGTIISAGTLQGDTTSLQGNITDNTALVFKQNSAGTFAGVISGSGSLTQSGSGVLTLTGANTYTGGTTIGAGTLLGDTSSLQGSITNNAALVFNQASNGTFAGAISGSGTLAKSGNGTLTLNGSNPLSGTTTVTAGKLVVGDDRHAGASLGGTVTVNQGATLGGIGTIGGLNLAGAVAPGNSIGTLSVTGNAVFQPGSIYQIEAAPNGSSDRIAVGGTLSILGGSALVLAQPGTWAPRTDYTILTAAGGVSGQFASVGSSLAFLTPVLSYTANAVNLSLQRNDVSFIAVAQTPNQAAVAGAASPLGFGNPVYIALAVLDAPTARQAFDQLSGEIHASTRSAIVDGDRHVREAINQHLLGMSNGANGLSANTASGVTAWSSVWGHWGSHDSDGSTSPLAANGSGLLLGADLPVGASSRLGAAIGTGQGTARIDTLGSSSHVLDKHLAVYGSTHAGALQLQAGATYGWQTANTNRSIAFGNFAGMASSRYHATTQQAFVDSSYAMTWDHATLAPFVNVAHQRLHTHAITESGTAAALNVNAQDSAQTYATLGLRGSFALDARGGLHAHASVGWQHAWGDTTPRSTMRFASGGSTFDIAGVPVARNAAAISGGLSFMLAPNVSVDATYSGQFASHARDQAARMNLTWAF